MRTVEDKFFERTLFTPQGCWFWTGAGGHQGHGQFWDGNKQVPAHRWAYEHFIGKVEEQDTHHTCRNRSCVNPDHIKPVSRAEHMTLHDHYLSVRDMCGNGHLFTEENTLMRVGRNGVEYRRCLPCRREHKRAEGRRRREANKC